MWTHFLPTSRRYQNVNDLSWQSDVDIPKQRNGSQAGVHKLILWESNSICFVQIISFGFIKIKLLVM